MTATAASPSPLPPGPRARFPGEMVYRMRSDPLAFLTRLAREYGDFAHFRMRRRPFVLVNDPDAIREILVTRNEAFQKSPALRAAKVSLGEGLLTSEGDFHKRQRRLSQPAFHPQRVASYADAMSRYCDEAAAAWREGEVLDAHDQMMRLTLRVVTKTLFDAELPADVGRVGDAMAVLVRMFRRATNPLGPLLNVLPLPSNVRFLRALRVVHGEIDRFVREHRETGTDRGDLLSMLMRARDAGGGEVTVEAGPRDGNGGGGAMTDLQLRNEVFTLFTAGHETTANALTFTWYLLGRHPEAEARLHEEVDRVLAGRAPTAAEVERLPYARAVVSESMRLYPPAWIISREAKQRVRVGPYELPAGAIVFTSQWVTHRDARWWPDPEQFDPGRWLAEPAIERPKYAYYPFGGGPRSCIGEFFARMEAVLIIASIARHWRMELLDRAEPVLQPTITLRPRDPMRVKVRRRT